MNLSVIILTKNEEKNIPACIKGARFADEIIVIDDNSEDKTVEIAKKAGAKVYKYKRIGYVEPARNYAISKATGEWILILDADEQAPEALVKELKEIVQKPKADYYRLPRKNIIFGKWIKHSRWWPDYNIRFFRKEFVSWSEIIHSVPITQGKGLDLQAREDFAIIHYHYDSIEQFVERMNRYTGEHAKLRIKDGYKFKWQDLIRKPTEEFLGRYFSGEGYKDGTHGLALASLQAFSELVLYLKIWQKKGFEEGKTQIKEVIEEMKDAETDIHYWQADALLKSGGGIIQRIKRRLKL
ncbi:glycosyltransferase family 2 protein [Candidatus Woesebacteria bacterium]|nr:glycosyltransferase family 2 protein [Candidatus Woesebacteria bacterium]